MQFHCPVNLIGQAPAFLEVLQQVASIANIDPPVLIDGETGTGKELIARAIHYSGARSGMPFIAVNCGTLPDSLVENEFFGRIKGANTDARDQHQGLIAQAQGGTLFLDEVDALPVRGQVALLRFLEDQRYRPAGATRDQRADVRIITATTSNLEQRVARHVFRPDLYYRLKIFTLRLPALRERLGDAELLTRHFVQLYCTQYQITSKSISAADLDWIKNYHWPGNVRELENLVHRAVVLSQNAALQIRHAYSVAEAGQKVTFEPSAGAAKFPQEFRDAKAAVIEAFERSYIERALMATHGNVSAAARMSGKERRAFGKLMKKHGLSTGDPVFRKSF